VPERPRILVLESGVDPLASTPLPEFEHSEVVRVRGLTHALELLRRERFDGFVLTKFSGQKIRIVNGTVSMI